MEREATLPGEEGFWQAICDKPDDDLPRLAYADWLEEHGDPRAEYLRLLIFFEALTANSREAADLLRRMHHVQFTQRINRKWVLRMCRDLISKLLREFKAGAPRNDWPNHDWHREYACRFDALPVYADMGGCTMLRPDGELLLIHYYDQSQPLTHFGWRLIALASGAEFFPEIRPLLPPRPPTATCCSPCQGEGLTKWWLDDGRKGITGCARCWGLGWLPQRPAAADPCPGCAGVGRMPNATACGTCGGLGWQSEYLAT